MIVSVIYYIGSWFLNMVSWFLPEFRISVNFLNALTIVLVELAKWNYIFPVYALLQCLALIATTHLTLIFLNIGYKSAKVIRG